MYFSFSGSGYTCTYSILTIKSNLLKQIACYSREKSFLCGLVEMLVMTDVFNGP